MYTMKVGKTFKELCTPAMLYFVISVIAILVSLFSGVKLIALAVKAVFVIIWTILLNMLCKNGYKAISWFLVLLPYVLMLGVFFMTFFKLKEGFEDAGLSSDDAGSVAASTMANAISEEEKEKEEEKAEDQM